MMRFDQVIVFRQGNGLYDADAQPNDAANGRADNGDQQCIGSALQIRGAIPTDQVQNPLEKAHGADGFAV